MRASRISTNYLLVTLSCTSLAGCLVERRCFDDRDCPAPRICSERGACVLECTVDGDCQDGWECDGHRCVPGQVGPIECPNGMSSIGDSFCMDTWEASRPDATATSQGIDESLATSRPGVLPWTGGTDSVGHEVHNEDASRACAAAGKRLCTPAEWGYACGGSLGSTYVFGNDYSPTTCNSLDLYPGVEGAVLMPTGSFAGCVNEWGVYDLGGNAYEHVAGGSDATARGGSYKSLRPMEETLRCDYVPTTWIPCYCSLGFRCCLAPGEDPEPGPEPVEPDATASEDVLEVM
jgi:hypothetical protein